jgi:ketosteroid isomerase-like protein
MSEETSRWCAVPSRPMAVRDSTERCATTTVEIEWTSTGDYIERATYRGHDGLRRYLGTMEEEFKDLRIEPVELIDAGQQVISSVRFTGRGKASGAPVEMTLISVGSLRDGLIYRVRNYPDMAAALEAAGLRE